MSRFVIMTLTKNYVVVEADSREEVEDHKDDLLLEQFECVQEDAEREVHVAKPAHDLPDFVLVDGEFREYASPEDPVPDSADPVH